jgi:hypothetical protein
VKNKLLIILGLIVIGNANVEGMAQVAYCIPSRPESLTLQGRDQPQIRELIHEAHAFQSNISYPIDIPYRELLGGRHLENALEIKESLSANSVFSKILHTSFSGGELLKSSDIDLSALARQLDLGAASSIQRKPDCCGCWSKLFQFFGRIFKRSRN